MKLQSHRYPDISEDPEKIKWDIKKIQDNIRELEITIFRNADWSDDPLWLLEDLMKEVKGYMIVDQVFSLHHDDPFRTHLTQEELIRKYLAIKDVQSLSPYYNAYTDLQKLKNEVRGLEEKIKQLYKEQYPRSKIPDILVVWALALSIVTDTWREKWWQLYHASKNIVIKLSSGAPR